MPNSRVTLMVRIRHATPLFRQRGPQKKPMLTALRKSDRLSRSSPSPPQLSLAVAAFTGARRGEIRGLLWENYHDGEIQITRSIWRGHITEPKTRKSRGAIPVIAPLARRLEHHPRDWIAAADAVILQTPCKRGNHRNSASALARFRLGYVAPPDGPRDLDFPVVID